MFHRVILSVVAGLLFLFAILHALSIQRPEPNPPPPVAPPTSPFGNTVAGAGMVEPSNEASGTSAISIGSQLAGVLTKVCVHIGQEVKIGDQLFELDKRLTEADLKMQRAAVKAAEADVLVKTATLYQATRDWGRAEKLFETGGVAQAEYDQYKATFEMAKANLELSKANVEQARARAGQDEVQLALLEVRAPVDGTILQVNVRLGEYVTTLGSQSLILMGSLKPLHIRVNVDEEDLPRLRLNAPARAKLRGDPEQRELPLWFVRLEPYVIPKVSLTGINVERVDTRVAQVIYALDPDHPLVREKKVLVGQLVDVFIDTSP